MSLVSASVHSLVVKDELWIQLGVVAEDEFAKRASCPPAIAQDGMALTRLLLVLQLCNVGIKFASAKNLAQACTAKQKASYAILVFSSVFVSLAGAASAIDSCPIQRACSSPCTFQIETGGGNAFQTFRRRAVEDPTLNGVVLELWKHCQGLVQHTGPHIWSQYFFGLAAVVVTEIINYLVPSCVILTQKCRVLHPYNSHKLQTLRNGTPFAISRVLGNETVIH
mmetsp:Transcript_64607/g.124566  ORF Transcript_64607/g.124566 Transcript_64607/m.124566 type:complete len:224 (+) Transcript_64607:268-939(+)